MFGKYRRYVKKNKSSCLWIEKIHEHIFENGKGLGRPKSPIHQSHSTIHKLDGITHFIDKNTLVKVKVSKVQNALSHGLKSHVFILRPWDHSFRSFETFIFTSVHAWKNSYSRVEDSKSLDHSVLVNNLFVPRISLGRVVLVVTYYTSTNNSGVRISVGTIS